MDHYRGPVSPSCVCVGEGVAGGGGGWGLGGVSGANTDVKVMKILSIL